MITYRCRSLGGCYSLPLTSTCLYETDIMQEMNKEFYCETCGKQYKNVGEMSNHYSSYDHHHVKVNLTVLLAVFFCFEMGMFSTITLTSAL